jgi:hypothetical protein
MTNGTANIPVYRKQPIGGDLREFEPQLAIATKCVSAREKFGTYECKGDDHRREDLMGQ